MSRQNTYTVLSDIDAERRRQDAKWGEQNHPSVSPLCELLDDTKANPLLMHLFMTSDLARKTCERRFADGEGSWADIALEELCEAIEVGNNPSACRAELVQLGAVVAAWIECIDRANKQGENQ